jgi:ferredoxin
MGALVCSPSSYAADLVCAGLIGLCPRDVPTVAASIDRGLCPESIEAIRVFGDPDSFALPDFKKLPPRDSSRFRGDHLIGRFLEKAFGSGPRVSLPDCVGCGKCVAVCPNHAVTLRRGRAVIDRRPCIRCFCCQEFCPVGAISVHRPPLARLLGK